jgi:hypothetical protein
MGSSRNEEHQFAPSRKALPWPPWVVCGATAGGEFFGGRTDARVWRCSRGGERPTPTLEFRSTSRN